MTASAGAALAGPLTVTGTSTLASISASGLASLSGGANIANSTTLSGTVTFTGTTAPSFSHGLTSAGATVNGLFRVSGNPSITVVGTAVPGYHNLNAKSAMLQTGTATTGGNEFLAAHVLYTNVGSAATINTQNKVALYAETDVIQSGTTSGSGPAWSLNTLLYLDSSLTTLTTNSLPGGGTWAATGYELDVRNDSSFQFGHAGVAGSVLGLSIGAGGLNSVTGAIYISGVDTATAQNKLFTNGLTFAGSSIYSSSIVDYASGTWSYYSAGTKYWGMDFYATTFQAGGSAMRLAKFTGSNLQSINAFDSGPTLDVRLLAFSNAGSLTATSLMQLGSSAVGAIQVNNPVLPDATNTRNLGSSSLYFANGYITNVFGTLYSPSTPSLKSNIADLPDMLPVVMAIRPRSYQWVGGMSVPATTRSEHEQIIYGATEEEEDSIEVRGGVPTQVVRTVTRHEPIMEDRIVVDETGNPVILAGDGDPPVSRPLIYRTARTETRHIAVESYDVQPDPRAHYGFLAPDFKAVFDGMGINYGGYVKGDDGVEGLRADAQVAILWKALQELAARVAALEQGNAG